MRNLVAHTVGGTSADFKNRVLRKVFVPKRYEVTGEWRKLHNEELNNLYCSHNIVRVTKSRRMRWAEHVARIGERRVAHKVLVGKPEGKRPLGRHRPRWEDNIEVYLKQPRFEGLHWIDVAQHSNR